MNQNRQLWEIIYNHLPKFTIFTPPLTIICRDLPSHASASCISTKIPSEILLQIQINFVNELRRQLVQTNLPIMERPIIGILIMCPCYTMLSPWFSQPYPMPTPYHPKFCWYPTHSCQDFGISHSYEPLKHIKTILVD